jgi:acetylornithine/succinyldiaminopimelate/putrescine aminotransferase
MAAIAREAGALLVYDEIQTGLGRCGDWFYANGVGVQPDLITLAKGIASGIPAAAVIVAPAVASSVKLNDQGTTFGGGPVAMAAMKATIEIIEREELVANAARMGELLRRELTGLRGIAAVRGKGLLLGIELTSPAARVQAALLGRRVVAGTSSAPDVLRLLPPLTIGKAEVREFVTALQTVLEQTS